MLCLGGSLYPLLFKTDIHPGFQKTKEEMRKQKTQKLTSQDEKKGRSVSSGKIKGSPITVSRMLCNAK